MGVADSFLRFNNDGIIEGQPANPALPLIAFTWLVDSSSHLSHIRTKNICSILAPFFFFFFGTTLYWHTTVSPPVRQPLAICSDNLQASGTFLVFVLFAGSPFHAQTEVGGAWLWLWLLLRAEGCSPFSVHALCTCACVGGCMYCVMLCCYVCDRKLDVLSYVSGSWLGRAGGLARGCWLRCRDGDRCYFGFAAFLQTHELFNNTCPFSSTRMARQ